MAQKKTIPIGGLPSAIIVGMAVSILLTLSLSAILAILIAGGKMSPETMGYGVLGILMSSSILGAAVACAKTPGKRMIVSSSSAAGYLLLLLCTTALFFGGEYQGVGVTALVVMAGGLINALLPAGKAKRKNRTSKKRRYG